MNTDMNLTNFDPVYERYLAILAKGGIRGADDDGGDGGNPPADPPAPPAAPAPGMSQEEINRIVGQRTAQAKRTALKDWAESQGMSQEEVEQILKDHKTRQDSETSELTKAQSKATEETGKRQQAEASLARTELNAMIDVELVLAGITKEELPRIRNLITLEPGATEDEVVAEVETLKTTYPALFTNAGTPPPPSTPPGMPPSDPGKPPGAPRAPSDVKTQARSLFESRHPRAVKN